MTIAEIESTLHTLLIRHPNLDEVMLITLLTAGGWEEKTIKDAVVLFKSLPPRKTEELVNVDKIVLPKVESVVVNTSNTEQTHQKDVFVDVKKTETALNQSSILKITPPVNLQAVKQADITQTSKSTIQTPAVVKPTVTPVLTTVLPSKKEEVVVPPKPATISREENVKVNTEEIVYIDSDGKEEDIIPALTGSVEKDIPNLVVEHKIVVPTPTPAPTLPPKPVPVTVPLPTPEKIMPKVEVKPVVEVVPKPQAVIKEKEIPKIDTSEMVYFDGTGNEERELKNFADDGKELPKVVDDLVIPKEVEEKKIFSLPNNNDPQSLIVPKIEAKSTTPPPEPPENLPMKPFESAPHVWPFSKYKEVFHGKVMPILSSKEQALVDEQKIKKEVIVKEEEHLEVNSNHKHIGLKIKRTGFDGEDEGLILMTGVTLLIILLLLAYMYSNGRL